MILVFGGNGQLGCDLVRAAQRGGVALEALPRSAADVADANAVGRALATFQPALVVNAAAYTKVDQAEVEIAEAERGNAIGPAVIAAACEAAGVPLVHISTDYVFDGTKIGAYVEDDPVAPLGVYGRTKAAGETAVRNAAVRHVIIRTAWLYGEFGQNFLRTIVRLARERDELRIVADQRGCPTSTRELAEAILRVSSKLAGGEQPWGEQTWGEQPWGTYHFAGAGIATWHDFAVRIVTRQVALTGHGPKVTPITTAEYPTRAQRPKNSAFDCSQFERVFGFRARPWQSEVDELADIVLDPRRQSGRKDVA